jgi:hypothetical protein
LAVLVVDMCNGRALSARAQNLIVPLLIWTLANLLQTAFCAPAVESCWDCLAQRSSQFLANDDVIKSLVQCNPQNASAAVALSSFRMFGERVAEERFASWYSSCLVLCGAQLQPLLLGEALDVSARAIMKCALRSLSMSAIAYSLRATSLRCMLAALRVRRPFIATHSYRGNYSDAFVYMGPPHNLDLRGKRGAGNWAEFKLSLQVVSLPFMLLPDV